MFESLGYAVERKVSARQVWAFPLAAAIQLSAVGTFTLYSLFSPETLQPPPVWISALPAIPVTLRGGPDRPPRDTSKDPVKPLKREGLVQPNTQDLTPTDKIPNSADDTQNSGPGDDGPGVPGLLPGTDITGILPTGPSEPHRQVLQAWEVTPPRLIQQTQPIYPAAARAMNLGGKVILQVIVDEEGRVTEVQILQSTNALFNQSAAEAVRQWRYTKPIAHGGQAVACYLTVVVSFQTRG
jgi:periplasmic protein TonB